MVCVAVLASVPVLTVVVKVWAAPVGGVTTTVTVAGLVAKLSELAPPLRTCTLTASAVP